MDYFKLITVLTCIFFIPQNFLFAQVKAQDGKIYKTVKIGNQVWMAENLNVSTFRNGDPIPQEQDSISWRKLTTAAWCYYDNNVANGSKYGKLYNWYAVKDPRNLAPEGWHIPTIYEWNIMLKTLGDSADLKLKSAFGWENYEGDVGKGTNESGFTALPGGYRTAWSGGFLGKGVLGYFWTSTSNGGMAWPYNLYSSRKLMITKGISFMVMTGLTVRCIKDSEKSTSLTTEEFLKLGKTKFDQGNFREAISVFNKAIEANTFSYLTYYYRGLTKSELNDNKEAIQDFSIAIGLNPKCKDCYVARAYSKGEIGQDMSAINDYTKALGFDLNDNFVYYNRGVLRNNIRDFTGAIEDFNRAIELDPKQPEYYISRGKTRIMMGDKNTGCVDIMNGIRLGYKDENNAEMIKYCR